MINAAVIKCYLFVYLFALFGGVATVLIPAESDVMSYGSTKPYLIFWAVLYITTVVLVLTRNLKKLVPGEVLVLMIALYAPITTLWSQLPKQTLSYSIALSANLVFILYASRAFSTLQLINYLRLCLNAMIAVGLLLGLLGYEKALFHDPLGRSNMLGLDLIKGFFSHKIYSGIYSGLAFVLNLGVPSRFRAVWCMLALVSVVISGSATGLTIFALLLGIYWAARFSAVFRVQQAIWNFVIVIVVVIVGLLLYGIPYFIELLGRDPTLTGRTDLWQWGAVFISEKPVFGWGYFGIFADALGAPSERVNEFSYYIAPHFHNGYIQVFAELGAFGGIAFIFALVYTLAYWWLAWKKYVYYEYLLAFCAVACVALSAFVVNVGLKYNDISTFLLFAMFLQTFWPRGEERDRT